MAKTTEQTQKSKVWWCDLRTNMRDSRPAKLEKLMRAAGFCDIDMKNQFVAITCGLTLSLAGLFSGFLPTALQRLVPSGYYTLLTTLRVDWASGSSTPLFSETTLPLVDYALVATLSAAACVYACTAFSRREV